MTAATEISMWTAIGTGLLAVATFVLARQAAAGNQQTNRHHKENLRPYCVIEFDRASKSLPFGPEYLPRRGKRIGDGPYQEWAPGQTSKDHITIAGTLSNKGMGPAKTLSVYLNRRFGSREDDVVRVTMPNLVAPILSPGETIPITVEFGYGEDIMLAKRQQEEPVLGEEQKFDALMDTARSTVEVVVEYQDVFDSYFRTTHPNGAWMDFPGDVAAQRDTPEGAQKILERPDKRPPTFLEGRQPSNVESRFFVRPSKGSRPPEAGA